ncbi:bifunctional nuclease family protein [Chloroflexota bacterium]
MIELTIDSIRENLMNYQRVVILKEKDSNRYLPIWIGPAEADAIAVKLQGVTVPRPLTHDLLCSFLDAANIQLQYVVINELKSDTFFAKIYVTIGEQEVTIDSRPSDALAIAVRADAPVYAEESVLDKAGIVLDSKTGKPLVEESDPSLSGDKRPVNDDEMKKKMSAFYDFINTLDLDDFDKRKS